VLVLGADSVGQLTVNVGEYEEGFAASAALAKTAATASAKTRPNVRRGFLRDM
jgi:hypothetical protein